MEVYVFGHPTWFHRGTPVTKRNGHDHKVTVIDPYRLTDAASRALLTQVAERETHDHH